MTTAPQGSESGRTTTNHPRIDKGNIYGIVMMQMTMFCFVTNDTLSKFGGSDLPPGQVIFIRGFIAVLVILLILAFTGAWRRFRDAKNPIVLLRAFAEAISGILFMIALQRLPLPNVSALLLTIPLVTTASAAIFLGETVGIRRWTSVLVGMLGVLAIVRPGLEGFNFYSLFVLGAVAAASTRDLIARKIPSGSSLWVVTMTTMTFSCLAGAVLGTSEGWVPVGTSPLIVLSAAAIFLTLGQFLVVIAMTHGEVSVVSSFRYISMPISLFYGYMIWGHIPDALTWLGIILILSAGIYTMYRERQIQKIKRREQEILASHGPV
ncbi:Permease of the drug/metabolite transporter (DMT) superfamily [Cohaesibacter sp. ES.047]|uniref:DMT family transporter n=1 Tax=Cohaesibacter sp. ES.047 TaxID=1798205 RepID=UPI000BB6F32B|nr:DMT family transporter [Cohaesibacter sp. ES.047]SNY93028.1 Permease of the drug/metabolite transporter (DMT) superfamily [Cohaesibacter sp. ES.047]